MTTDDRVSVREARAEYFARAGFPADGGYAEKWVKLKLGSRTVFAFPNSTARLRSVRLHDLHHIVTGYDTSWRGEAEIAAWELAAGCADHAAAWVLNLGAAMIGLVICPLRVAAAFRRGRRSDTLYRSEFSEELLAMSVRELRDKLRVL
jgi:hypothetical protein